MLDKHIYCNKCKKQFIMGDYNIASLKKGDLEVQYFSCPSCGEKYLYFTSDSKMRDLIQRRKTVQKKLLAANAKQFQERAFKKYLQELDKIKKEQLKILPALKARGEKILRGEGRTSGKRK